MDQENRTLTILEIQGLVTKINSAWKNGNIEKLEDYFHEDMMIAGSDFAVLGKGRSACVNSYREFLSTASEIEFTQDSVDVSIWGKTSAASYSCTVSWKSGDSHCHETGKDMFIFSFIDHSWKTVWRMICPGNNGPAECS